MWEPAVARQMPFDYVLSEIYTSSASRRTDWHKRMTRGTQGFLARIGKVLEAFQQEFDRR